MIDPVIVEKFREKYSNIHPLIFQRSLERSEKSVDLFDILDTVPTNFPIVWCDKESRWIRSGDIYRSEDFFLENENI